MTSHPVAVSPVTASLWALGALAVSALVGLAFGRRLQQRHADSAPVHYVDEVAISPSWWTPAGKRELFITTTPGRYPQGRVVTLQDGRYQVTHVQDLGTFSVLGRSEPVHQYRVWGQRVEGADQ